MTYHDTLEGDLARAKEILAKGKAEADNDDLPDAVRAWLARQYGGGTIYGADIYVAYKLLESFVSEIERLHAVIARVPLSRIDHNGECLDCDEQAAHAATCPYLVALESAITALRVSDRRTAT
jgi:hypothetical protein